MSSFKKRIKKTWFGRLLKRLLRGSSNNNFENSGSYWEKRYRTNDNSGPGSYGRLAEFKAEILNTFVAKHDIETVIEFGVGDGNQLSLANYPKFIGYDVSETALKLCKEAFKDDPAKQFYSMDDVSHKDKTAQLVLSLDVLYHLIEDEVFDTYMKRLFDAATDYVIIYSSNYNEHLVPHVRCREFTKWIDTNVSSSWSSKEVIKNRYPFNANNPNHTSMADFYIYERLIKTKSPED